jgi:hypothetical protein
MLSISHDGEEVMDSLTIGELSQIEILALEA